MKIHSRGVKHDTRVQSIRRKAKRSMKSSDDARKWNESLPSSPDSCCALTAHRHLHYCPELWCPSWAVMPVLSAGFRHKILRPRVLLHFVLEGASVETISKLHSNADHTHYLLWFHHCWEFFVSVWRCRWRHSHTAVWHTSTRKCISEKHNYLLLHTFSSDL